MDFKFLNSIKEKYPNSIKLLDADNCYNNSLFEFFDKHKLRGSVHTNTAGTWSFDIWIPKPLPKNSSEGSFTGWNRLSYFSIGANTREEAEYKLYEEMFKMLEERP